MVLINLSPPKFKYPIIKLSRQVVNDYCMANKQPIEKNQQTRKRTWRNAQIGNIKLKMDVITDWDSMQPRIILDRINIEQSSVICKFEVSTWKEPAETEEAVEVKKEFRAMVAPSVRMTTGGKGPRTPVKSIETPKTSSRQRKVTKKTDISPKKKMTTRRKKTTKSTRPQFVFEWKPKRRNKQN